MFIELKHTDLGSLGCDSCGSDQVSVEIHYPKEELVIKNLCNYCGYEHDLVKAKAK